jgi:FMN phosphatase YigB (HAD superfamily)
METLLKRSGVEAVLFDLGGVVIQFQPGDYFHRMLGMASGDPAPARWDASQWVKEYESGRCDRLTFAAGMIEDFGLEVGPQDFVDLFRRWPNGIFDGAAGLAQELSSHVTVGCLSNTNECHWWEQTEAATIRNLFGDHAYLSFELGVMKPGPEIYAKTQEALDLPPEKIMFFDDRAENAAAARNAGWQAHHVRGPAEARAVIEGLGSKIY